MISSNSEWNGYKTEVSANVVFAINSAYQEMGMSKDELRHLINIPFFVTESEDLVWSILRVMENGSYMELHTKGEVCLDKREFTPLEIKLIEKFIQLYSKKNINPLQLFVENYMEKTILVNHLNKQIIKTSLEKHFI